MHCGPTSIWRYFCIIHGCILIYFFLFFFMLHCNNHSCKDPTFSPPLFVIKASNSLWSPASTAAEYFIGIKSSNSSNITVFCWINNADAAMARSAFDGLCSSGMRWMDLAGFLEGWRWQNPPDNVQLSASNASLRLTKRFPDYILFFLMFSQKQRVLNLRLSHSNKWAQSWNN